MEILTMNNIKEILVNNSTPIISHVKVGSGYRRLSVSFIEMNDGSIQPMYLLDTNGTD